MRIETLYIQTNRAKQAGGVLTIAIVAQNVCKWESSTEYPWVKNKDSSCKNDYFSFLFFRFRLLINFRFDFERKFMFLSENGLLPEAFKNMFVLRNQVHSHNTRYSTSYHLFTPRTNIRMFSLRFQGPRFFNSLPQNFKDIKNISLFKSRLKSHLLQ